MRTKGQVSKVAICAKCKSLIQACHIDHLTPKIEKELADLANEGFTVKLETIEETRARRFRSYHYCLTEHINKKVMSDKITTEQALSAIIALHDRESAGDETITLKEWQNAINASRKALNNK